MPRKVFQYTLLNNLLYGEPLEGCLPFILLSQTEDCSKGKAKGDGISAKIVFNAGVTKLFVSEFFTRETSKEKKRIGFDLYQLYKLDSEESGKHEGLAMYQLLQVTHNQS